MCPTQGSGVGHRGEGYQGRLLDTRGSLSFVNAGCVKGLALGHVRPRTTSVSGVRRLRRQPGSCTLCGGASGESRRGLALANQQRFRRRTVARNAEAEPATPGIDSSEQAEGDDETPEVKVMIPRVIPVTVVSGSDTRMKDDLVERLVKSIGNQRKVCVVSTSPPTRLNGEDCSAKENGAGVTDEETSIATARNGDGAITDGEVDKAKDISSLGQMDQKSATKGNGINRKGGAHMTSEEAIEAVETVSQDPQHCEYVILETGGDVVDLKELVGSVNRVQTTRVDTMLSVVNVETFMEDMYMTDNDTGVHKTAESPDYQSAIKLVNVVEHANVIALLSPNNTASEESFSQVADYVLSLNSTAEIVRLGDDGSIPAESVIDTGKFDPESFDLLASWRRVLLFDREAAVSEESKTKPQQLSKAIKDSTFLYRGHRPFHPKRLYNHIKDMRTFSGVIKSVGTLWLATRMNYALAWNQAGGTITLKQGERFWASVPEDKWPSARRDDLLVRWDERFGDRQTEIVFVGRDFDKSKLQSLLDSCLLQDDEMVFNQAWESFDDPFVEFVPAEESLEEEDEEMEEEQEGEEEAAVESPEARLVEEEKEEAEVESLEAVLAEEREEEGAVESPQAGLVEGETMMEKETSDTRGDDVYDSGEGKVKDLSEVPGDILDRVTQMEWPDDDEGGPLKLNPRQDPKMYDQSKVIIASGDAEVADEILDQMPRRGLPVTVVTGFLGAGKTSLINYILTQNHGLKIAVLVNEFGEIDIDNQLVDSDWEDDDTVMLNNGCICCSINDSFLDAVSRILMKSEANQVDYLIVETTGIADPVPIVNSLMATDLEELVYVDSIVTLVDAENFDDEHMNSSAALSQVAVADTVLLSKTDIASAEQTERVINLIKDVRQGARILRSQRGAVPLDMILDVRLNRSCRSTDEKKEHVEDHSDCDHDHGQCNHDHPHGDHDHHDHAHDDHEHDHDHKGHLEQDGFMSTSFQTTEPFDVDLFFKKFLSNLPQGVFRSKGLLYFKNHPKRYVFQLSGRRYQLEEDDWPEGVTPNNQVVVIGRDLDIEELKVMLTECCVS